MSKRLTKKNNWKHKDTERQRRIYIDKNAAALILADGQARAQGATMQVIGTGRVKMIKNEVPEDLWKKSQPSTSESQAQ